VSNRKRRNLRHLWHQLIKMLYLKYQIIWYAISH